MTRPRHPALVVLGAALAASLACSLGRSPPPPEPEAAAEQPASERPAGAAKPRWVARCATYSCVGLSADRFDPYGLGFASSGDPADRNDLLIEVTGPANLEVSLYLGRGRCGCDDCDESSLPGPTVVEHTFEIGDQREVVDVGALVEDWNVENLAATARVGQQVATFSAAGWPLCM